MATPNRYAAIAAFWLVLGPLAANAQEAGAVITTYAGIAQAMYEDSQQAAEKLSRAVDQLLVAPGPETLQAARKAWIEARVPYQQTEGFRFGNAIVDDWEGRVNSWPLDEGLIDYVDVGSYGEKSDENPLYTRQCDRQRPRSGSAREMVDASKIDKALLAKMQEAQRRRGQCGDAAITRSSSCCGARICNGTGPGAGNRPASDYDAEELHRRQLRPARGPISRRQPISWSTISRRWRRTGRKAARRARSSRPRARTAALGDDPHRPRLAVLWRACRRADEARADAARSRGGA